MGGRRVRGTDGRGPVIALVVVALVLIGAGVVVHEGTRSVRTKVDHERRLLDRARATADAATRQGDLVATVSGAAIDHLGAVVGGYRSQIGYENAVIDAVNQAVADHNSGRQVISQSLGDAQAALATLDLSSTALALTNAQARAALSGLSGAGAAP